MSLNSWAYYRASLSLLRHVEARQPTTRRFGGEADALWAQLRGELTTADRIDLLLRDADAHWLGAFGARTVFRLRGVAEDDAFGAEWAPLDGVDAERLWREFGSVEVSSSAAVLRAIATAWDIGLAPVDLRPVGPAEQLIVAGPSAVAALVGAFEDQSGLNWGAQVAVVATLPGHRQIAAAAAAILGATQGVKLIDQDGTLPATPTKPRLVLSGDAQDGDAAKARALTGSMDAQ